jgi:phosphoglucosamine mutase
MNRRYFGTDGIRGRVGDGPLVPEFLYRLGWAAAQEFAAAVPAGNRRLVIGRDTRASGPALAAALAEGFRAAGWQVESLGVLPTPALAMAVDALAASAGAMITASHNPAADNGVKFFAPGGQKLTDEQELSVESRLPGAPNPPAAGLLAELPASSFAPAILDAYRARARGELPPGALTGWRIAVDTAHGATCATTPRALRELGAELVTLGDAPDGTNINAGVGSEHPQQVSALVRAHGARLGLAHDGDGDRLVLVDETGAPLDGDEILVMLACHALRQQRLSGNCLVVTVQSNLGVDAAVAAAGGRVVRTAVGDRYVGEAVRREGAGLGGESSGHFILPEVSPTGDGLAAALRVIATLRDTGRPLSALRQELVRFPQRTGAVRVREKRPLESLPHLVAEIAAAEQALAARGRVLVRYSGTEPKLRLLVEAADAAQVEFWYERLAAAVAADLERE